MNPLDWKPQHQVALIIAMVIGAALGPILGYLLYASGRGADGAMSFSYWLSTGPQRGVGWWALFGAALGGGLAYVRRLNAH